MDAKSTMLKSRSLKEKRMKEQFESALNHKRKEDWNQHTYPDYKNLKEKNQAKFSVKPPDFTDFGEAFEMSTLTLGEETIVQQAYSMAIASFFKAKSVNFPTWLGIPEIKVGQSNDPLHRTVQFAWYAKVPNQYVINPEDRLEDELWNS